jgi:thymidine phosphorylase
MLAARGDRVERGQPLVELYHRGGHGLDAARALCREAIHIAESGQAAPAGERILGEVR